MIWDGILGAFFKFVSLFSCLLDFVNMWSSFGKTMYFEVRALSFDDVFDNLQRFFGIAFCIVFSSFLAIISLFFSVF